MSHGKPLDAGVLRHVIAIQDKVTSRDDRGDIITAWVDVFPQVYASIDPLSAREFIAAASVQSKVTTRITIRFRPGVNAGQRIVHKGKIYNIEGVLPDVDSGMEYLTLPCSEGVNEG